jgi:hypothetical protein
VVVVVVVVVVVAAAAVTVTVAAVWGKGDTYKCHGLSGTDVVFFSSMPADVKSRISKNFYMRGDGTRSYFFTMTELNQLMAKVN